jgi:hypothetical protein
MEIILYSTFDFGVSTEISSQTLVHKTAAQTGEIFDIFHSKGSDSEEPTILYSSSFLEDKFLSFTKDQILTVFHFLAETTSEFFISFSSSIILHSVNACSSFASEYSEFSDKSQ